MMIVHLPEEVLGFLYLFLASNRQDQVNFMKACQSFYQLIRCHYHQYPLSYFYSRLFLEDDRFRLLVGQRITSLSHQLVLKYRFVETNFDIQALPGVHHLTVSYSPTLFDLSKSFSVPFLHTLILHWCPNIEVFPPFSVLSKLERLEIHRNDYFTTTASFASIPYLVFESCTKLHDISSLNGQCQRSVSLIHCPQISCVDMLQSVYRVTLKACPKVKFIDSLTNVTVLTVIECSPIIEFTEVMSHNRKLQRLHISQHVLPDLQLFNHLYALNISRYHQITDISCLAQVKILNLSYCQEIVNVEPLKDCIEVNLTYLTKVRDISALARVRILDISYCYSIISVQSLIGVRKLTITGAKSIRDLSNLVEMNPFISIIQ